MSKRVVIVGGGVIGTACAWYLRRSGWDVAVIEKGKVGGGSSSGNCGLVCPSHVLPLAEPGAIGNTLQALFKRNSPFVIRPRLDPALWSWLIQFARRCNRRDMMKAAVGIQALLETSLKLYEGLVEHDGLACEWERRGLLFAYKSREALLSYRETNDLLRDDFHCPAHLLEGDALTDLEPAVRPGLAGGWYYDDDAHLRPDVLMKSWRSRLEADGVAFHEDQSFKAFAADSKGRASAVVTDRGEFSADTFVVATGALTPLLNEHLGCGIPIQPGKGYSLTMPRPAVCPKVPIIFPETRVAVTPFQSGYRLGSTMEFSGYDESIRGERLQLLRDGALPYLQEPFCEPVEDRWYGWRPMTYDSLPIIDRSPAHENVWISAGHNMLGLSMAPATGQLVSELLDGRQTTIDPEPYRVSRFV